MTIFRFRYQSQGMLHTRVRLFVGKPGDTLALSGEFILRANEWQAFMTDVRSNGLPAATFEFVQDVQP